MASYAYLQLHWAYDNVGSDRWKTNHNSSPAWEYLAATWHLKLTISVMAVLIIEVKYVVKLYRNAITGYITTDGDVE